MRQGRSIEDGFEESFNGKPRDQFLNVELFRSIEGAQPILATWRADYNHQRPHSAFRDETPAAFAAKTLEGTVPPMQERPAGEARLLQ